MTTATETKPGHARATMPAGVSRLRVTYVAYPSSLTLRSANAVQTLATARELRALLPGFQIIVPRFARRPSAFAQIGAAHLARLPFNAGSHFVRSIGWSYMERTWFAWRVLIRLLRQRMTGDGADTLYVRDAVCAAWFAMLARRLTGAAVIYEVHDLEAQNPSANSGPITRRLARFIDRIALRDADGIVSLTETFVTLIRARRLLPAAQSVRVIPDAYDAETYAPRDQTAARRALGLADDAFVVVYVGLTWAYRGLDRLVDAFARARADVPDARLLLVGGRERERAALAAMVAQCGLEGAVQIVPPQPTERVPTYLAAADALVLADTVSKASASPLKLFEYAAMARPIVAVDLPALREILPADAVCYVPVGDAIAFADALRWIATHTVDAAAMAARARRAVAPYTYHARAAAIAGFCREVTGSMRCTA